MTDPHPDRRTPDRDSRAGPTAPDAPDLQLRIVEYDGRPDRATVHPPEVTGMERAVTWLSVDAAVVVDLAARR